MSTYSRRHWCEHTELAKVAVLRNALGKCLRTLEAAWSKMRMVRGRLRECCEARRERSGRDCLQLIQERS